MSTYEDYIISNNKETIILPDYYDFIDHCLNTPDCWASLQNQSPENVPHYCDMSDFLQTTVY